MSADETNEPGERPRGQPGVLRVFQTREQTRAFYDKISGVYDLLAERSEAPVRERGLEMLAPGAGEHILEIGCGTGHSLVAIARAVGPGGRACGVDLSEGMLERTRRLVEEHGLSDRVTLQAADAVRLPWPDASFDAVFISFTLELFDTPEIPEVLAECRRVLRPGGRIAVVGMSRVDEQDPLMRVLEWTHLHFPNFVDCRPIFVQRAIEAAGFTVREAARMHLWVPVEIVLATPVQAGGAAAEDGSAGAGRRPGPRC